MANYKSRYTGQQVDDAIGSLQGLEGVTGIVKVDADGNFSGETLAGLKEELGSMPASDVYDWAKAETKPTYTAVEVGAIATTARGAADGVVPLNSQQKIDSAYLPSYVDDVLEYATQSAFPSEGEAGKIYVDLSTNKTYRWGGSTYVEISPSTVVTVSRNLTSGTESAIITIDGTSYQLYAPTNTDSTIDMTARGSTKAYVLGTTTIPNSTVQSATGVAETGIYVETSDGTSKMVAPTFVGNLTGTASGNLTANSSLAWNKLTNTPTDIAGYGITDAKIENGTITLGSETITPLTSYSENDPVFTNSAAFDITSSDITNWNSKTSNIGTITSIKTTAGPHTAVNISSGNVEFNVPTKTSDLTNDSDFITINDITPATSVFATSVAAVGTTSSPGTNTYFVRGDHVHNITKATIDTVIGVDGDTTKFYRGDGTWVIPPQGTVNAVKINNETKTPVNGVVDLGTISITAVTSLTTTAGRHSVITNQTGNVTIAIPTNVSDLTNDSNFTSVQITRW